VNNAGLPLAANSYLCSIMLCFTIMVLLWLHVSVCLSVCLC